MTEHGSLVDGNLGTLVNRRALQMEGTGRELALVNHWMRLGGGANSPPQTRQCSSQSAPSMHQAPLVVNASQSH